MIMIVTGNFAVRKSATSVAYTFLEQQIITDLSSEETVVFSRWCGQYTCLVQINFDICDRSVGVIA